jgi:hypothetical protein
MSGSDLAPLLVAVSMFLCMGWIVWVMSNNKRRQRVAEIQREMQAKLFERFSTSQEMLEYLKSEAGAKFLDSATIEHTKPFGRVLGSVQAGIILFLLGVAMMIVRATMPEAAFPNGMERAQSAHGFLGVSLLLMALGLGFLVSSAISYRLSKNWGLFDRELGPKR